MNVYGERLDTLLDENKLAATIMVENEPPVENAAEIKELVERLEEQGEFANNEVSRVLNLHLTAAHHFENQSEESKVIKHMNSFIVLLDQYKENEFISEDAYEKLIKEAEHLLESWS